MRLNRPWRCTSNCISGTKLSNVPRRNATLMLKNSRKITTTGYSKQDRKKKQLRSSKRRAITIKPLHFTSKEVSQLEPPTWYTIRMSASPRICYKKSHPTSPNQECTRKQENYTKRWICFRRLWIAMSRETPTRKQLIWPKMLNLDLSPVWRNDGVTTSCLSNRPKLPSTTSSKQKRYRKPLRQPFWHVSGTKPSNC